jgi:hypothetical protein
MIYHITYNGLYENQLLHPSVVRVNAFELIKTQLETTEDLMVFILTKEQWPSWTEKFNKYFKDYLYYEMPYFVTNRNYRRRGRRLRMVILKGKGNAI